MPERNISGKIKSRNRSQAFAQNQYDFLEMASRNVEVKPVDIHHIDVENLDCPKPGQKNLPKSVKQSLKKNRKNINSSLGIADHSNK